MDYLDAIIGNAPLHSKIVILAYPFSGADTVKTDLQKRGFDCIVTHDIEDVGTPNILVCLVRNYKECIIEHYRSLLDLNSRPLIEEMDRWSFLIGRCRSSSYISILEYFDKYNGPKRLLFYEDILALG